MPKASRVLIVADRSAARLRRAFERAGHEVSLATLDSAVEAASDGVEAVVVLASRDAVVAVARRLKTRFQMPLLPVIALVARPAHPPETAAPDAWLPTGAKSADVVERVEEFVRIRRAERELVRLSASLADLAAENGRLYERARRDAEATTILLRELQHRVRNNLAAIQALLVLERHRNPPRKLCEALDVAIGRLRSMAALQDSLTPQTQLVDVAGLARAVSQGALEVFGAVGDVECTIVGEATLSSRSASAVAIVMNELITNSLKHSGAHVVSVSIRQDGDTLELEIADDGRGMPTDPSQGSGLRIARAVVHNELAGTLAFPAAVQGTIVRISVPTPEG
jgi:two-component sensor histidine kinase